MTRTNQYDSTFAGILEACERARAGGLDIIRGDNSRPGGVCPLTAYDMAGNPPLPRAFRRKFAAVFDGHCHPDSEAEMLDRADGLLQG